MLKINYKILLQHVLRRNTQQKFLEDTQRGNTEKKFQEDILRLLVSIAYIFCLNFYVIIIMSKNYANKSQLLLFSLIFPEFCLVHLNLFQPTFIHNPTYFEAQRSPYSNCLLPGTAGFKLLDSCRFLLIDGYHSYTSCLRFPAV